MATDLTALLGGGGGGNSNALLTTLLISETSTFVPAISMTAMVYAIGAGGSGGMVVGENYISGAAGGGGAGGCAISKLDLTAGVTYTATIGAFAGNFTYTNGNGGRNGATGGATSFSGSGITTLTGNGGLAGGWTRTNGATAAGGAGGTASGGNVANITGGAGESVVRDPAAFGNAGRGGSVQLLGSASTFNQRLFYKNHPYGFNMPTYQRFLGLESGYQRDTLGSVNAAWQQSIFDGSVGGNIDSTFDYQSICFGGGGGGNYEYSTSYSNSTCYATPSGSGAVIIVPMYS